MKKTQHELIPVTKAFAPPFEEYMAILKGVWERRIFTNNGPLVRELEKKLQKQFGVRHVFFVSNGTIALQLAVQALGLKKKIITTPFSYVATLNSIIWEQCEPVFVDINPDDLCIDTKAVEAAITPDTEAIMAVHVFGNPCDVKKLQKIAKKHNLKIIYDAAHSFGTRYEGKSVLAYGDISAISFHATKVFSTGEGGAVVTNNDAVAEKIRLLRSFGGETFSEVGINGKNSEIHAALGLCNLKYVKDIIRKRKFLSQIYDEYFVDAPLQKQTLRKNFVHNYGYYPVIFRTEEEMLAVKEALEEHNIIPRRYFYPSLNLLSFVKPSSCPISESIASRILCLPLYRDLPVHKIREIARIVLAHLHKESADLLNDLDVNQTLKFQLK